MTEETAAAAATDVQAAPSAPAGSEQATPSIESIPNAEASAENAEGNSEQENLNPDEGQDSEQKRQSRSERYRRKISAQAGVIERIEAERAALKQELEELRKAKATDQAPNPAEFPGGEYDPAYIAKLAAHESLKAVTARLDEQDKLGRQATEQQAAVRLQQKLDESAARVRERLPDFEETLKAFLEDGGEFAPHVKAAIASSGDKAALLAYNFAKDPDLVDRLNAMSPQEALLEIGEHRAKARLPEPRKQTKAPAPIAPLTGGAAAPKDLASLAKSDDATAYWEARKAQK